MTPIYKKGWKENPGIYGSREGYGADHLECDCTTCTGQPDGQAQLAWLFERQIQPD